MNGTEIAQTKDFIASASGWNEISVMVFFVIIFLIVIYYVSKLFLKMVERQDTKSEATIKAMNEVVKENSNSSKELTIAINNLTKSTQTTLNSVNETIEKAVQKHEITHNKLNDIRLFLEAHLPRGGK